MSKSKGKTPKYSPEFKIMVIEDMIRNKMELEYLKKLDALVRQREQLEGRKQK